MRKIIAILILAIVFVVDIIYSPACLAEEKMNKDGQGRHITFNVPSNWTKAPGFPPEGSYSFLKDKGAEERLLIYVRTSIFTKTLQERIAEDIKIVKFKGLIIKSPSRSVKLGAFQWTFLEVSGTVKNIWGKPEQFYRLQYYAK